MMNKSRGITRIFMASLFLAAIFGCIPDTQKAVVSTPQVLSPTPLPMDTIDRRIAYFTTVLKNNGVSNEQRELASNLLETYKTIKKFFLEKSGRYDYNEVVLSLLKSLNNLEERYFSTEGFDKKQEIKVVHRLTLEHKNIMERYLDGDYQGVIKSCVELEASYGPDALTPEIGLLLALALAEQGLLDEAVNVGDRIVRELEGKPDLIRLIAQIIDWQIELGQGEKASGSFKKLMDEMQQRQAIFKSAEKRVIRRGEKIARTELPSEKSSGIGNVTATPDTTEGVLDEVDRLVKNHEFQVAKILLIKHRLKLREEPEIETIDEALRSVNLAEEKFQYDEDMKTIQNKEVLLLAGKLIEEEQFEQAITRLEDLEKNQDVTSETSKLKELAIEKIIKRERNRAAKLFLMADKAVDPEEKEALLVSSYDILKALIDNYPSSPLNVKINNHVQKIIEALDKLRKETD